jgi:excisionase family DNA binding protein
LAGGRDLEGLVLPRTKPRNWLTVGESDTQARKSTRTIRRWITRGDLPAHRINGFGVLIDQADLDKLIKPIPAGR